MEGDTNNKSTTVNSAMRSILLIRERELNQLLDSHRLDIKSKIIVQSTITIIEYLLLKEEQSK